MGKLTKCTRRVVSNVEIHILVPLPIRNQSFLGKLGFAGVDTYENEPTPAVQVLMTPNVSLTPHIGAATTQAQKRIGSELATQIISILK